MSTTNQSEPNQSGEKQLGTVIDTIQYFLIPNGKCSERLNGELNSKTRYVFNNFVNYYDPSVLSHSIKISSAIFPYSFYIINEYNNKLIINNTVKYIDYGNYNALTLKDAINGIIPGSELTLNDSTGKYTLISNNMVTINAIDSTINNIIGLSKSHNYTSVYDTSLGKYKIAFDYQVNTGGTRNIYIKSNLQLENVDTLDGASMTLKSIPVNVPPYGIIMYNNNENSETLIKTKYLDNLEIYITDDDGNYIDFNNLNWTVVVEIKKTKILVSNKINNLM